MKNPQSTGPVFLGRVCSALYESLWHFQPAQSQSRLFFRMKKPWLLWLLVVLMQPFRLNFSRLLMLSTEGYQALEGWPSRFTNHVLTSRVRKALCQAELLGDEPRIYQELRAYTQERHRGITVAVFNKPLLQSLNETLLIKSKSENDWLDSGDRCSNLVTPVWSYPASRSCFQVDPTCCPAAIVENC